MPVSEMTQITMNVVTKTDKTRTRHSNKFPSALAFHAITVWILFENFKCLEEFIIVLSEWFQNSICVCVCACV